MRQISRLTIGIVFGLAVAIVAAGQASDTQSALRTLLLGDFKFSPGDLTDLARGRVVTRTLDTTTPGEVAVAGSVQITGRKDALLARYRNIVEFKRGPEVLQIGRFSLPPVIEDLSTLAITKEDVDLRRCVVGDCDIRLPAETIRRFQHEIDWTAPDADGRAGKLFKEILLEHVRAYVAGGPGRIIAYDDGERPIDPERSFAALMMSSPYVGRLVPGLPDHLVAFRTHAPSEAEDIVYWSKEKFGLTPFITVTHTVIEPAANGRSVIASRDVYSSRYIDASLSIMIASDAADAATFTLTYVNRSIANALKGSFAGLRRSIVQRRTRNSLADNLRHVKRLVESGS